MAKKKKDESILPERETRVLFEKIESDVAKVAEGHSMLVKKLEEHDKEFATMNQRFDILEAAVSENGRVIKQHNGRFDTIDKRFDTIDKANQQINEKLDIVISNHEDRLKKLEVIR